MTRATVRRSVSAAAVAALVATGAVWAFTTADRSADASRAALLQSAEQRLIARCVAEHRSPDHVCTAEARRALYGELERWNAARRAVRQYQSPDRRRSTREPETLETLENRAIPAASRVLTTTDHER
jgi:hypothetical protein